MFRQIEAQAAEKVSILRPLIIAVLAAVLLSDLGCGRTNNTSVAPIELSAIDLHKAFMADPAAAMKQFAGKPLILTGEVVKAVPHFIGRTMIREVTVPSKVLLKTEVDYLPTDIKYVVCEGNFEVFDLKGRWAVDPRIKVGEQLRVACSSGKIHWSEPGLYLSDCNLL